MHAKDENAYKTNGIEHTKEARKKKDGERKKGKEKLKEKNKLLGQ